MFENRFTVFVSSTLLDNVERRELGEDAIKTAGMVPVGMERFAAKTIHVVDDCEQQAAKANLLVGILAYR
ncbi:MAG: DUF4062 domain-containing protein [Acidobacteriota bacterium]